jgi:hypothetical protein
MNSKAPTPHGRGVRGITLPRSSPLFEGNFGRIFRAIPPAEFGDSDKNSLDSLHVLAGKMVGPDDQAKDGADPEESGIPALYTYLGQFVDHDLTFDPASSLQQQNDIDALTDFRTPRFDLDNIYGRGPEDQPYLYFQDSSTASPKLLLGKPLTGGTATVPPAADLPRNAENLHLQDPQQSARAIIGDPRNDENVLISQLQGLFFRFHNHFVDEHPHMGFKDVQRQIRFHYQWMLINDFLPTLINAKVYAQVFPHFKKGRSIAEEPPVLRFYRAKDDAYMPLEFSAAAYRFGHSMIRPGYRLNDQALLPIFGDEGQGHRPHSLRGFMPPEENWGIDWGRFIDIDTRPNGVMLDDDGNVEGTGKKPTASQKAEMAKRLQLAYRLDTSVVKPLSDLPPDVADHIITSLIERNLIRGWRLRLPNGQDVARAMGFVPLEAVNIGRFEDGAKREDFIDLNDNGEAGLETFKNNCPLWVYILAETFDQVVPGKFGVKSRLLGPVGGTIVAETFAGLLKYDSHSFLNQDPRWQPEIGNGKFGLREFVLYALGKL